MNDKRFVYIELLCAIYDTKEDKMYTLSNKGIQDLVDLLNELGNGENK